MRIWKMGRLPATGTTVGSGIHIVMTADRSEGMIAETSQSDATTTRTAIGSISIVTVGMVTGPVRSGTRGRAVALLLGTMAIESLLFT